MKRGIDLYTCGHLENTLDYGFYPMVMWKCQECMGGPSKEGKLAHLWQEQSERE